VHVDRPTAWEWNEHINNNIHPLMLYVCVLYDGVTVTEITEKSQNCN